MRNLKKVLSLVLCLAVMLSVMVVGAGAAFSDQDKIENTEAVDACSALNIINGYEDGAFHPERNIKRAEVTKMICVALNGGEEPNTSTNAKPTFTDVRGTIYAWAEGYIESCYAQGIVDGVNGNRFAPASNVTAAQLAKMLLVSLGYNAKTEQFTGNAWETNVNVRAAQKHLYDGLEKMDTSAAVTRDQAAQMVWNAMQAYEVEYKDGVVQDKVVGNTNDKITLLRDRYDAWFYVGTLTSVNSTNITITMTTADENASDPKVENGTGSVEFTKLDNDYSALLGQKVKVLFKNGKTNDVIGVFALTDNTVYNTVMNAVENDDGKIKFDGKTYSVDSAIKVYVDNIRIAQSTANKTADFTVADFDDDESLLNGSRAQYNSPSATVDRTVANSVSADEVKFVDSDGNNKIDTAIIATVNYGKATYVSANEVFVGSTNVADASATYKSDDNNIAKDIEKNDYVVIKKNLFQDKNDITKANEKNGVRITGFKDNDKDNTIGATDKILVDGTWYVVGQGASMNSVQNGNTVDIFTINGVVVYAKRTTGENSAITDVAMVVAKGKNIEGDKVKIVTFDGKDDIVTIDTDAKAVDGYVEKASLKEGAVYELETKGDEYRFKELKTDKDYFSGTYTALNDGQDGSVTVSKNSSGAVLWNGKSEVADTAKVFIVNDYGIEATFDYKLITGKQLKSLGITGAAGEIESNGGVTAFTSDVNGIAKISYGVFEVNGISSSFTTNDNYGYITDTGYYAPAGYVSYKVWTGNEDVTVIEKKNNTSGREKGTVIGYSTIEEVNGEKVINDVTSSINLVDPATIYGSDSTDPALVSKITFDGVTEKDITKDTKILFVDTKDHKGVASGEIAKADEINGSKVSNAMYALSGDDVTVLVVDVKNNLHGNFVYQLDAASISTATDIQDMLAKGDVTINGALTSGLSVTVPADAVLTFTAPQTQAQTITLTAKSGSAKADGKLVLSALDTNITVSGTGTVVAGGVEYTVSTYNAAVAKVKSDAKIAATVTELKTKLTTNGKTGTKADPFVVTSDPTGTNSSTSVDLVTGLTTGKITATVACDDITAGATTINAVNYASGKLTATATSLKTGDVSFKVTVSDGTGTAVSFYVKASVTAS